MQYRLQTIPRPVLNPVAHDTHPDEKHTDTTNQIQELEKTFH
jgi:hypothetical protein